MKFRWRLLLSVGVCFSCVYTLTFLTSVIQYNRRLKLGPLNQTLRDLHYEGGPKSPAVVSPTGSYLEDFLLSRVQLAEAHNLTLQALQGDELCQEVAANPASFWISQPQPGNHYNSSFTADVDHARMTKALNCRGQWLPEYLKTPPVAAMFDFEKEYLSDPPLIDAKSVSSSLHSTAVLLNTSSKFHVGDTIRIKVVIKDGYGRRKTKGGDEIRAWIRDLDHDSKLSAHVTDFSNGTYLITSILPWQGRLKVFVELAYPREYFTALLTSHLLIKAYQQSIGGFFNTQASEGTPCYNTPVLPGYGPSQICNVTSSNGAPWYCGRPAKPELSCKDYKFTRLVDNHMAPPMLESEMAVLKMKGGGLIASKSNMVIDVAEKMTDAKTKLVRLASNVPCSQVSARATWEQNEPTGYFYKSEWQSLLCQTKRGYDVACRQNTEILLVGDSNARAHYYTLASRSRCDHVIKAGHEKWHKPLMCAIRKNNFTLKWFPHSQPFRTSTAEWVDPLHDLIPSSLAIDNIPSTGRHIVILGHYLHFVGLHLSAYAEQMVAIRDALSRAFKRNPNVVAIILGPHVLIKDSSYRLGDSLRGFIITIQRTMFKDLRDQVFYFPVSDLSIAVINREIHPAFETRKQINRYLVGLVCDRLATKKY
ncbi:unnamed protein product [Lymnaea stagnalis]|uniref:NXPE C-terminal domain-containing protein n=1 Tax=Lymnaea stagnalis TaxID=6523 RepID=A0AAV2HCX3_LYMST